MLFRYDLQCIRGYAMLFVYLYHNYKNYFEGGFLGVDIFFILSGFFSTRSLVDIINRKMTLTNYYCKRIIRLKPVADFVLLFVYIFSHNPYLLWRRSKDIISIVFCFSNYYFYYQSVNYLEQSNAIGISPLLHFWSLSVEIQYYLVSSILCYLFLYSTPTLNFSIIILIINYLYMLFLNHFNQKLVYFSMLVRNVELFFGFTLQNFIISSKFHNKILLDSIIILIWIISMKLCSMSVYPNYSVVFPLLLVFIIIKYSNGKNSILLDISLFMYLGKISYSFYLIHFPIIILYPSISLFVIILLSIIMYYIIENSLYKKIKHNTYIILYCVFSLLLFTILYKKAKDKIDKTNNLECKNPTAYINNYYFSKCILLYNKNLLYQTYILYLGDSHLIQWIPTLFREINKLNTVCIFFYFWIYQYNRFNQIILFFNKFTYPSYVIQCFSLNFNISKKNFLIYKNFIITVSSKVKKYVILTDNPRLKFNPNIHYSTYLSSLNCFVDVNCTYGMDYLFHHKNLFYIKNNYLCKNKSCLFYYKYKKLYYDINHITTCMIDLIKEFTINKIKAIFNINTSYSSSCRISYCILYSPSSFSVLSNIK